MTLDRVRKTLESVGWMGQNPINDNKNMHFPGQILTPPIPTLKCLVHSILLQIRARGAARIQLS